MENKMNKFGLERQLAVLAVAFACVCMWGCGEDVRFLESGSRKDRGFAMVSDTTALLPVHYYDHYEQGYNDWEECTKMGIRLVDTRGTEYCYWEGLVDFCGSNMKIEPLKDSTVFFMYGDRDERLEYFIWKINENPIRKKAKWLNEHLPISLNAPMRVWKNGKFLFNYYGKFALLDTTANTIMQISKEEAGWPDGVEDAQYFGDDMMTLVFISDNHCEFGVVRNMMDTLAVHKEKLCNYSHTRLQFNRLFVNRENFNHDNKSDCIFSIGENWRISENPVAKYYVQYFKSLDRE